MNKKLTCILLALAFLAVGHSRAGEQWKYTHYRGEGFTMGYTVGLPQWASIQLGWQFGPHWNVAVEFSSSDFTSSIDARYYLLDTRITPYVEAKAALAPSLMVGCAFGKFEVGVGAFCPKIYEWCDPYYGPSPYYGYGYDYGYSYGYDPYYGYGYSRPNRYELPPLFFAFTIGYNFSFGKW